MPSHRIGDVSWGGKILYCIYVFLHGGDCRAGNLESSEVNIRVSELKLLWLRVQDDTVGPAQLKVVDDSPPVGLQGIDWVVQERVIGNPQ